MEDTSNDILIKKNKHTLLSSFYSITENQEDISNSSMKDFKNNKPIITDNNSNNLNNNKFSKKEKNDKNDKNNFLNPYKLDRRKSSSSFNKTRKEQEIINNREERNKKVRKRGSQIKLINARTKLSQPDTNIIYAKPFMNSQKIIKHQSEKQFTGINKNLSLFYTNNINNNNNLRIIRKALAKSKSILSISSES